MSTPAVVKNVFAAILEGAPVVSKPGKQTAKKPKAPFAQTPALVIAHQMMKTDNTVPASAQKGHMPARGKSAPVAVAKSAGDQDENTQGAEMLMHMAGWDAEARPAPAQRVGEKLENTAGPGAPVVKAIGPSKQSARPQPDRSPATTIRRAIGNEVREPILTSISAERAAPATDKPKQVDKAAPSAQQAVSETGKAAQARAEGIAEGGRKSEMAEKSSVVVKEHAGEPKHVEAKANTGVPVQVRTSADVPGPVKTNAEFSVPVKTNAELPVPRMAEPPKGDAHRTERNQPSNVERIEAVNGRPLIQTLHGTQQVPRGPHSQARSSPAVTESAQNRQVGNGTTTSMGGAVKTQGSVDGQWAGQRQAAFADTLPPEPVVSGAERPAMVSQPASGHASTAGDLAGSAKALTQSVTEQIRDSMHASLARGERQVMVRLHPPELGSVLVRFGEQNDQIHGVLEVSRSDIRHELEQALPEVMRSLQDLGLQVRRFEVTVADASEKDAGRHPLQQDASPQQQGSDRYTHRSTPEFQSLNSEPQDANTTTATGVLTGRIDMLV